MNQDLIALQALLAPLFPGLMGLQLTEVGPERVVATMSCAPTCAPPAASCTAAR